MTINGEDCSDRQVIADNFNDVFSTIGESNEKNIRKHNGSHFQDRPISRVVLGREVDYRSRLIYVRYCLTNTTLCL